VTEKAFVSLLVLELRKCSFQLLKSHFSSLFLKQGAGSCIMLFMCQGDEPDNSALRRTAAWAKCRMSREMPRR
jgi:hypothetical protein